MLKTNEKWTIRVAFRSHSSAFLHVVCVVTASPAARADCHDAPRHVCNKFRESMLRRLLFCHQLGEELHNPVRLTTILQELAERALRPREVAEPVGDRP